MTRMATVETEIIDLSPEEYEAEARTRSGVSQVCRQQN
jgi:hypothetical protein